ncbi:MAG: hypothetical protein WB729_02570 [Candidatus Sulfotelmatobacter sp.]
MSIPKLRLFRLFAAIMLVALASSFVAAQDDTPETPLGDIARNLRKKVPDQQVIDNDNLGAVMEQVQAHKLAASGVQYSIDSGGKTFQISSPDASCRLSFSANSKALLSTQYTQMQLPPSELAKLEGPASIDGSSLQVSVFNGTGWHVSEIAIAMTLVTRSDAHDASASSGAGKLVPAVAKSPDQPAPNTAEKIADLTTLYRVRAAAAPLTTTVFRTPLDSEIGADQEWHWAIVEAKGYPPQRAAQGGSH